MQSDLCVPGASQIEQPGQDVKSVTEEDISEDMSIKRSQRPILRPYQEKAVQSIETEWTKHRSTLLVLPTGAGKTVVFGEVARLRTGVGRTLVLAHRDELIEQAMDKLRSVGLTCEKEKADQKASKLATSEVVVASVQTLKGHRLRSWPTNSFSTVIIDEAHHVSGQTYLDIIKHFGDAKVLGVTATPDRSDGVGLGNVFSSVAHSETIPSLVKAGYLAPIKVKRVMVQDLDISQVRSIGGELSTAELERVLGDEAMLHQIASPLAKEAKGRPTVVFFPGVQTSQAFESVLSAYIDPKLIGHIDGSMPAGARKRVLDAYQAGEIKVVTNCMVLTEGFDAPHTSCIAIARPTKSRSLYAQMVGRGTRLYPGKEDLLVMDFRPAKNGKHSLVGPADMLGGKPLGEREERILDSKLSRGQSLTEAMEEAIEEAKAEEEREREEAEERARRSRIERERRRRAWVDAQYVMTDDKPTEKQAALLKMWGLEVPGDKRSASKLIDKWMERKRLGLCTYKQYQTLTKMGLSGDITKEEASKRMDYLSKNGWRITKEVRAKWGR